MEDKLKDLVDASINVRLKINFEMFMLKHQKRRVYATTLKLRKARLMFSSDSKYHWKIESSIKQIYEYEMDVVLRERTTLFLRETLHFTENITT